MNSLKTLYKKRWLITSLTVLGFGLAFILLRPTQLKSLPFTTSPTAIHGQAIQSKVVSAGIPVRLIIPKINVDAPIDPLGLLPNGDMQAPSGPRKTGWYKYGPHPGDAGNAVIAGHYGTWQDGEGSVFDNLNKLQKGDTIYVQGQAGVTSTFVVRQFIMYGPDEVVPAVFVSSDAKAHLNLITCQGAWNQAQKSYSNRLVVFADKKA